MDIVTAKITFHLKNGAVIKVDRTYKNASCYKEAIEEIQEKIDNFEQIIFYNHGLPITFIKGYEVVAYEVELVYH